jgi:hypothetical protein
MEFCGEKRKSTKSSNVKCGWQLVRRVLGLK